jgi:hypothetical protein
MSPQEADTNSLADFPAGNPLAQGVDSSHNFMTGDTWESDAGQDVIDRSRIRMANAAGFNANANLAGGRIYQRASSEIEYARARNFNRFVCSAHLCSKLVFGAATSAPIPPGNDYGGVFISWLCPCEVARAAYKCVILQQEHYLSASLALSSKQIDFYGAEVLE